MSDPQYKGPVCEIEKKFMVPSDYHQRLEKLGFTLINKDAVIFDIYYDLASGTQNSGKFLGDSEPMLVIS